jgi:hypothetical protein
MQAYKEITYGWVILLFILPGVVLLTFLFAFQAGAKPLTFIPFLIIISLFSIVILLFYRMRVIVWNNKILLSFGVGLIWKAIEIANVESIEVVKNPFYFGWGIRMIPKGTMYNISGTRAIELHFKDTNRIVRIGSKNPEQLKREIEARLRILSPGK